MLTCASSMIFETQGEINILGRIHKKMTPNLNITFKKKYFFLSKEEKPMAKLVSPRLGTHFWVKTLEHILERVNSTVDLIYYHKINFVFRTCFLIYEEKNHLNSDWNIL